ncbi:MAG: hypothetical protein LBL79_02585 [Prevotella sp.]|jgi:hypothetical protein|nr:hypothetical protein [Prevotella sp.]
MIGAAINAGIGLAGSIFGGINAAKQRRKMNQYLNQQDTENKAWYNANALSDYTQRADAQNLMGQLRNTLTKQNKIAANTAVVTGATPEQQAVQKEQSNKVISDTFSNLGSMGQQYKDRVTDKYLSRRDSIANQRMGMMEGAAQSYENLMGSGLNMLGGSLSSVIGGLSAAKPATTAIPSTAPLQRTISNVVPTVSAPGPSVDPTKVIMTNPYS